MSNVINGHPWLTGALGFTWSFLCVGLGYLLRALWERRS